ncbi:hypothetical protein BDQ17DRAFT_400465 [Cyathus striatus]|nr:hypothetical protein BDQ17DRAFT_400465 [Cyathus striatus]
MWFATTFGLTVMETWEQILFLSVFGILLSFFLIGAFWYLPIHLLVVEKRAVYYLWGHEDDERHWWKWLGFKAAGKMSAAFNEL